jgi:F-type H+-transporting ATPase subunit alpha
MKKVAGTLKLDQAQYRELEAFAKFGSDLDAATLSVIDKGSKNVEILKQGLHASLTVEKQIAIIYLGTKGFLKDIPITKVKEFESDFLQYIEVKKPDILQKLKQGIINDEITSAIEQVGAEVMEKYKVK